MKTTRTTFAALTLLAALTFATDAHAQVKQQVFAGGATTSPTQGNVGSRALNGGYALIIPASTRFFIRPFVGAALTKPDNGKPSLWSLQAGALVGFKVTPNFAVVGGASEVFLFPKDKASVRLDTWNFSTTSKITNHFGLFTPVSINKRGVSAGIQLGFTW